MTAQNIPYDKQQLLTMVTDACHALAVRVPDEPPTHDEYAEAAVEVIWPLMLEHHQLLHHYEAVVARIGVRLGSLSEDAMNQIVHPLHNGRGTR